MSGSPGLCWGGCGEHPGCCPPISPQALQRVKMSGSIASYEQLVRQVEALRKENSHLRRELQDNSSHLCKLENETSDMKVGTNLGGTRGPHAGAAGTGAPNAPSPFQEVLKHLQGKLEQEARVMVSSGQTEVLDQLKGGYPGRVGVSPC